MDWIKRNLLFVIGSAVSLILMGLAGYYLYTAMNRNSAAFNKLGEQYAELDRLNKQNPHPGADKVDNIKAAKDQEAATRAFIAKSTNAFAPIAAIPSPEELGGQKLDEQKFSASLHKTLDQLRKGAANAGVQLTTNFCFSFTAENFLIQYEKSGLHPLSAQLGEVKVMCDILFAARINALDSIRREKVSREDREAKQTTDYLDFGTKTNEIATVTPYEISIRCFSSELADILAGFANSPHCLIVRALNVDPAVAGSTGGAGMGAGFGSEPAPTMPGAFVPSGAAPGMVGRPGFGFPGVPGVPLAPGAFPPQPAPAAPGVAAPKGGLPTLLDEKQLKVTLLIDVVKFLPKK
jgi:hypothetical protein